MAKPIVLDESPLTMAQVRAELTIIRERDGELNFRANKTEDYLQQFNVLDIKKAEVLTEKLTKLEVSRLKPLHIAKFVDILPTTIEDVKVLLQAYPALSVNQQNIKKIADTIKEFI